MHYMVLFLPNFFFYFWKYQYALYGPQPIQICNDFWKCQYLHFIDLKHSQAQLTSCRQNIVSITMSDENGLVFLNYKLQVWPCTHFGVVTGNPTMVMAFAGNKADLEDKRKVTAEVSTTFLFYSFTVWNLFFDTLFSLIFLFCLCSNLGEYTMTAHCG